MFSRDFNLAPSYDETDMRLSWNVPDGRYTLIRFVRDVFER